MKNIETVSDCMTPCPVTLPPSATIDKVIEKMEQNNIRHIPVAADGKVIGILSEREIKRYEPFMDSDSVFVSDVMVKNPYQVNKKTPLVDVVKTMAEKKMGSVIVTGNGGNIVGIFTTTDALVQLAKHV